MALIPERWRDRLLAPPWIRNIEGPLAPVFMGDRASRRMLALMRASRIGQFAATVWLPFTAALTYQLFPPFYVLESLAPLARVASVAPSVGIFLAGAVPSIAMHYWNRYLVSRYSLPRTEECKRTVARLGRKQRAQWELDDGSLRRLAETGTIMLEAINGAGRRTSTNLIVSVGSILGTVLVMGSGGLLMLPFALPVAVVVGLCANRVMRQSRGLAKQLDIDKRMLGEFESLRTTVIGRRSLQGLGISLEMTDDRGAELFNRVLHGLWNRGRKTDWADFWWACLRDTVFVVALGAAAVAVMPASTLAAGTLMTGLLAASLSNMSRDLPFLHEGTVAALLVEELEDRNRKADEARASERSLELESPSGDDCAVELRSVTFLRSDGKTSDPLSLTFRAGQLTLVIGPNGCGKTTALEGIKGFRTFVGGEILIGGVPHSRIDPTWLAERVLLIDPQTDLRLAADILPLYTRDQRLELLAKVGLTGSEKEHLADCEPPKLSSGERNRLSLLTLVDLEPDTGGNQSNITRPPKNVVLLDESDTYLDQSGHDTQRSVLNAAKKRGTTIVVVSNTTDQYLSNADRVVVLGQTGKVLAEGPPQGVIGPILTGQPNPLLSREANGVVTNWLTSVSVSYTEEVRNAKKALSQQAFLRTVLLHPRIANSTFLTGDSEVAYAVGDPPSFDPQATERLVEYVMETAGKMLTDGEDPSTEEGFEILVWRLSLDQGFTTPLRDAIRTANERVSASGFLTQ